MSPTATLAPFGSRLRRWRVIGGLSQLELAHRAATTSRHLSFLETGRSRPSREMVARLAEALALPLRERNALLAAAGFPAVFAESPLAGPDLAPFRAVLDRLLAGHEPFPAFVVDRHWSVVATNRPAEALLPPEPEERNVVRLTYDGAWRDLIDNWDALAWAGVHRLERESGARPDDAVLADLAALARRAVGDLAEPTRTDTDPSELVLCPHFRWGPHVVRTVSVIAHFGHALDVTLEELRVELVYPADPESEAVLRELLG